jgi:hypothetical protein
MSQSTEQPYAAKGPDQQWPVLLQQTPPEEDVPTERLPRVQMPPQQTPTQPQPSEQIPQQQMLPHEMQPQPGERLPGQNQARVQRFGWLAVGLAAGIALLLGMAVGAVGNRYTTAVPAATVTVTATATATKNVTAEVSKSPSPSPSKTAETAGTEPSKPKAARAVKVTERQWAKVLKDPDAHSGKRYIVYGQVTQFDSATGKDTFRADTAHADTTEYGNFEGANTILTGDEEVLPDLVEGDVFRASVTVVGSYDYDTQIGGDTTVLYLAVHSLKVIGHNR